MDDTIIYLRALSNGEWFGAWAPVKARLEWLRKDEQVALFTLTEPDLDEDDEYEFYQQGALLIARRDGAEYKVLGGVEAEAIKEWKGKTEK
jgi:hypothetical protein